MFDEFMMDAHIKRQQIKQLQHDLYFTHCFSGNLFVQQEIRIARSLLAWIETNLKEVTKC